MEVEGLQDDQALLEDALCFIHSLAVGKKVGASRDSVSQGLFFGGGGRK